MKDEIVWLSQQQMSKLFERNIGVISRLIKNIFEEELDEKSNLQKMQIANQDKPVYRVKSKNGVISFDGNKRIDATLFIYFLEFIIFYIMKIDKLLIIIHLLLLHYLLQSLIQEKNILIDLVMNFLCNEKLN